RRRRALPCYSSIFFFQAEDGIRGFHVTGVQTCALPIWPAQTEVAPFCSASLPVRSWPRVGLHIGATWKSVKRMLWPWSRSRFGRSEERRVGKEGRARRWPGQYKENEESVGVR